MTTSANARINAAIRAAHGTTITATESDSVDPKERAAVAAGLPISMAGRLVGDDDAALAADAADLARTLALKPNRTAAQSLNDEIRAAAGRPAGAPVEEHEDRVSMDGGARQSVRPAEDMNQMIRSAAENRIERAIFRDSDA
jgi:hypothetical protein